MTAFYELATGDARNLPPAEALRYGTPQAPTPAERSAATAPEASREWLTVKLRYKQPEGGRSTLIEQPFAGVSRDFNAADADFRFGTSVAMAALILRQDEGLAATPFEEVGPLAAAALGSDPDGHRTEFVGLLKRLAARPH